MTTWSNDKSVLRNGHRSLFITECICSGSCSSSECFQLYSTLLLGLPF